MAKVNARVKELTKKFDDIIDSENVNADDALNALAWTVTGVVLALRLRRSAEEQYELVDEFADDVRQAIDASMDRPYEPTNKQLNEFAHQLEALGIMEKVRDGSGNVVMEPGADGKPQIVWRRTDKELPKHGSFKRH